MFYWELNFDGVLSALLAMLIAARFIPRRLSPSRGVYAVSSIVGLCSWAVFLLSRGKVSLAEGGTIRHVWQEWLVLAPLFLPLEAALLGWFAVRPTRSE